jgi:Ribonuclease G/E
LIDEVLISALGPDRRAACLARGRLRQLAVSVPGETVRAGDVMLGRVTAIDRRLAAAFVDIGAARPALLMLSDTADPRRPPAEGESVLARVVRAPDGSKGAKLSGRPALAATLAAEAARQKPPVRLRAAPDPAIAAACIASGPGLARIVADDAGVVGELRRAVPELAGSIEFYAGAAPLFAAEGIDEQIEAALAPSLALPSGGVVLISETAAVVAIDVDLAAASGSGAAAARATNIEAMQAIAEAIVLRELAGHIVIDPLPSRDRHHRAELMASLRAGLAADDRELAWGGFTPLGLIELTRARTGPSLAGRLTSVCTQCGSGRQRAGWAAAGDALRALLARARQAPVCVPRLCVAPAVAGALAGEMAPALAIVADRLGAPPAVAVEAALAPAGFRIENDGCEER